MAEEERDKSREKMDGWKKKKRGFWSHWMRSNIVEENLKSGLIERKEGRSEIRGAVHGDGRSLFISVRDADPQ